MGLKLPGLITSGSSKLFSPASITRMLRRGVPLARRAAMMQAADPPGWLVRIDGNLKRKLTTADDNVGLAREGHFACIESDPAWVSYITATKMGFIQL